MKQLNPGEVAQRGWDLYDRVIRHEVEPEHMDRVVVIDVHSGGYVLADEELDAFERARSEMPDGVYYLVRVGRRAAHRIGPWTIA